MSGWLRMLFLAGTGALAALAALILPPATASAVLLATGDGTGNTSAPPDDPGFANVGIRGGLHTIVYVGNRWVLGANHPGFGDVSFDGIDYSPIPGSKVRIVHPADATLADMQMFRLQDDPGLPPLVVATATPAVDDEVTLVGNGRNRGAATSWMGIDGWEWGPGQSLRWGTNRISDDDELVLGTQSFEVAFDPVGTADECEGVTGDSGGAVFQKVGGSWELAGILFASLAAGGQPSQTTLYGNRSYAADLAFYREQIVSVATTPSCSDGLDDDGDGFTDWPADDGCRGPLDASETGFALPALEPVGAGLLAVVILAVGLPEAQRRTMTRRV